MKKYVALVLAFVIALSVLPFSVLAATSGKYIYEVVSEAGKTCVITKYNGTERNLTIPSTLNGYTVVEIGPYAFFDIETSTGNMDIRSVNIPSSVKKIGKFAFNLCSGLNTVTLTDGINVIEEGAFFNCGNLATINLPDSITYIGRNILHGTKVMPLLEQYEREDPKLPATEPIFDMSKWTNGALYIGKHLMAVDLTKSGSFTVKEGTKTIAGEAFYWCDKLTSVSIPNSVVSIGEYAFYNCTGLKSLSLPESVSVIGESAFNLCEKLQTINIPSKVTEIGDWTFSGCKALKNVTISGSVKRIGTGAYCACTSLTSVKINSGVEEIGKAAFYGCSALSSVSVADSVKKIGQSAFALTNFYNTSGNWKSNALYAGNHLVAVKSASGTYSVTAGTKAISEDAFAQCKNVTEINIPSSVTGISDGTFVACTALKNISVAGDNSYYSAQNGILYNKDGSKLICCPASNSASTMTMSDSVRAIADYAFYGNKNLVNLKLSKNLNSIGQYAFYDCNSLSTVEAPESVNSIGEWAFAASEKLTVYVTAGSYAEKYAKENQVKYDYLGVTLKDSASGVSVSSDAKGILPTDGNLSVKATNQDDGSIYSINVTSGGETVSPNGNVTVKIPVPSGMNAESCKVYLVSGEDHTYMNAYVEDGCLVFNTTKLGDFLVTTKLLTSLAGDANGDGKITAIDARIVLQIAAGAKTVSDEEIAKLDVSGDGKITAIDARRLLKIAAGGV